MKPVILLGDRTDHGGKVITGLSGCEYKGQPVACVGDLVDCPKCDGVYRIVEGSGCLDHKGVPVAVEGMKTGCGAKLIASQYDYAMFE
ncbi:PAAR domain-containing protein [Entomomonas sp. E2T0]|nr:PAAR domain-containing protein [Entomomonas sp. E2T0]UYZ85556.1 PAAR domain-containing protein [Entomomonas sp. E2T0]